MYIYLDIYEHCKQRKGDAVKLIVHLFNTVNLKIVYTIRLNIYKRFYKKKIRNIKSKSFRFESITKENQKANGFSCFVFF